MNKQTIVVAAAAGALIVSAGTAFALAANGGADPATVRSQPTSTATSTPTSSTAPTAPTSSDTPSPSPGSGQPRLSAADATLLVQERLGGGQVHEVERELEHGRLEWKVEIAKDGVTYDIRVDAETGDVTRVDTDDDRDDD